ncbi:MAG: SAM-dependent DNA methyltransferase [Bacteroidaceae bacterium]|nr:SAM-dependent DNA methyltransferase [Bacteroidaceae bacterium]
MNNSHNQIVSLIWNIADDVLRDVFLRGQYRDVILPMVVLRRLDALLEPTKDAVEQELAEQKEMGLEEDDEDALKDITGLTYYNKSKWTLNRLKSQAADNNDILYDNFITYLDGYSDNVKDVLTNFEYYSKAKKLANNDRLLAIIERITDPRINLTDRDVKSPDGLSLPAISNVDMGTLFEELLRRFNEENNEEAGEHFTPRDAIILLSQLVFEPIKDNLPQIISIYDPACGSGGMLTESREYLLSLGVRESAIQLSGTECNPETYAICKSDLIIKGVNPDGMNHGNTITENHFADTSFGYMITNPPYGKSWKEDKKKIYHEKQLLDHRFELSLPNFAGETETLDCTPRTSDGQLLFMLENVDKMKTLIQQPQGSRIASIHNGSSLFTGDAGSGEGNIRRYLVENDFVEAIVQLPNNIFYNTGISTYVWLLSNNKEERRRGKIQLIDASQAFEKLRKNQGSRNCTIAERHRNAILNAYLSFAEQETDSDGVASKIFDGDDFRYHSVTIERPLRLRCQFNALRIDELLYDKSDYELSKWLYDTYGELVYTGLDDKVVDIKEYFQENEIKVTDKKLAKLIAPKNWCERRDLSVLAYKLMHEVGSGEYMDYNVFIDTIAKAADEANLKAKAADLKSIARAMSVPDENAEKVIKKIHKSKTKEITRLIETYQVPEKWLSDYGYYSLPKGGYVEYESDSNLRDSEKIPVKEDIYTYFMREVRPYVDEAWINLPATKIGCDISFNKYFYKPEPLRSLEENERDIRILEEQSQGLIQSLFA